LEERQDQHGPGTPATTVRPNPRGEHVVAVVVIVHGQTELLEVVLAAHAVGRLAHALHRRQQQTDEHGNDGDDHQELDEGETPARSLHDTLPSSTQTRRNTPIEEITARGSSATGSDSRTYSGLPFSPRPPASS